MADFEKTEIVFDKATAANWLDTYRTGKLIELPARGDLMFTGDLHGSMENFGMILKIADLQNNPDRHLVLHEVVHQLEMGRDQSFRLLEKVAYLKAKYQDRVHVLMGNHDLAEVQGREIFKGGLCLNLLFEMALEQEYGAIKDQVRAKYNEFIKTMPIGIKTPNHVFISHSTPEASEAPRATIEFFRKPPEPADYLPHSLMEKILWGRDFSPKATEEFAKAVGAEILLVGHTPCPQGFNVPSSRHIILDSKDKFATYLIFSLESIHSLDDMKDKIRFLRPKLVAAAKARTG